ncbi:efflux transporter outer membrane subunit [Pararobbsia alpina]|uniref:Toluene efflux pump outer membrane protein TtgC n=1 Tax=Pararobbsia alpina TaxID=621374 RepID=A0A6S7BGX1_9BURK|nr:efflux transporter outer membrane subunit [Pararobbsia alpina]CAB3799877.1 Toluene efflux pump outer membrane protein TtgC [Pararobbsia alpina]
MNRRLVPILLSTAIAASLLAGCQAVGPNYHMPDHAVAKQPAASAPFISVEPRAASSEPLPDEWWQLYQEPVLDDLVRQALTTNTDLRVAQANLARAQAGVEAVEELRRPSTGITAGLTEGQLSGEQYLQTAAPPFGSIYQMNFHVAYQLDLFGQIRRGIEAAKADTEAAQAAYDVTRVTVAAETARAYADVCGAGLELSAAHHILDLEHQSSDLTAKMVQAGRGVSTDVTNSEAQVAVTSASIPTLEAQQKLALYHLATLTGRPPAEFPKAVQDCETPPRLTAPIPVGDGAALLKRRPDIRGAERTLAASTARIGVAVADLYPKITLGLNVGSIGYTSVFLQKQTDTYTLGPLISWEFPNVGAAKAKIAAANATTAADYARFDGVVLTALREVESALTVYARDLDRESDLKTGRARAATALSDAMRLQQSGRQGYLPVLSAEQTVASSDASLASQEVKLAQDQIDLFLALGGGWGKAAR